MTSLQVRADSVRSAVSSTSTCTPATVAILSDLLLSNPNTQETKYNTATAVTTKERSATQTRNGKEANKQPKSAQKGHHESVRKAATLSTKEKSILATEVINSTLKALSSPLKSPLSARRQQLSKEVRQASTRNTLQRTNSLPRSPLQPRSLNRVSSSPNISSRTSRSSSSSSITSSGPRAVAECSRVAFACLRELKSQNSASLSLPSWQLENGMSALIGRLITLGMDDLALKEVRILKRRLDTALRPSGKSLAGRSKPATLKSTAGPSITELLDFESPPSEGPVLSLAISTQLQLLKLLAVSKNPNFIADAYPKLELDYCSSPTQLLLRFAKESSSNTTKAARQLESLAQLILSLCPSVLPSEDSVALAGKLSISPQMTLQLQTLALRIRRLWWKLSEYQGDAEKELLEPFSRCLAAFGRRASGNDNGIYDTANRLFRALLDDISDCLAHPRRDSKLPFSSIYQLLGTLAQESGRYVDAVVWIEKLRHYQNEDKTSQVRRCAMSARFLCLKLRVSPHDQVVDELLMEILEVLDGSLICESGELDELLAEVSQARRAAIQLLSKRKPGSNMIDSFIVQDGTFQMCESLIFLCPRFSMRYLGTHPSDNATTKDIIRYEQRRHILAKLAPNVLDSALFLIKILQSEKRLTWELMDSVLSNCLALLENVNLDHSASRNTLDAAVSSYYVRISNFYFSQHLNMRRDTESPKEGLPLRALRRSVESVKKRSGAERKASMLTMKLERMAEIQKELGRLDEAIESFRLLCKELVEDKVLTLVAETADSRPFRSAWNQNDDTLMLARATASLIKLYTKDVPTALRHMPFSDPLWSSEERGAMLEHVLAVLCRQNASKSDSQKMVVKELLGVYDPKTFPVRRLRVITYFLRHSAGHQRDLIDDAKSAITFVGIQNAIEESKDSHISLSVQHLLADTSIILEFMEDHPRIDLITPHLAVWYSMVNTCKDYSSLEYQIDDVSDFIIQLHSIADFLDMKGFGKTRAAVLRMIVNVIEMSESRACPDEKILGHAHLASQYLELGYSGKAGMALDRAQTGSFQNGVSPQATLRVLVTYADYLLRIGNVDKCEEVLSGAQAIVAQKEKELLNSIPTTPSLALNPMTKLIADACIVHSKLSLERGSPAIALWHAKQSLRLMSKTWAKMERKARRLASTESYTESKKDDVSNGSVSIIATGAVSSLQEECLGPSAWWLVKPMYQGLLYLSKLYADNGMFQDTCYYAEQSLKIVTAAGSSNLVASALTSAGCNWLSAGIREKALQQLRQAKELNLLSKETQLVVTTNYALGKLYGCQGDATAELAAYEDAQSTLERLSDPHYITTLDHIVDSTSILQAQFSQLSLATSNVIAPVTNSRRKATSKKGSVRSKTLVDISFSISDECVELASLKGTILRQKSRAMLASKRFSEAIDLLKEAGSYSCGRLDAIDQHFGLAKQLFVQSLDQLCTDPVYSVLQDSTISFPAVVGTGSRTITLSSERNSGTKLSPAHKLQPVSSRNLVRSKSPSGSTVFDKLRQAQEHLVDAHSMAVQVSSTAMVHTISSLLGAITILLSASGPSKNKVLSHPGFAACTIEMARISAIERQRLASSVPPDQPNNDFQWPNHSGSDFNRSSNGSLDFVRFQKDYIDIIPHAWAVVSISLSESQQDLCLTRFQAGHRPFVLRLPLGRNNSRDADEQVFGYEQGKAELQEIIDRANISAHGGRDINGRAAKAAWWAERDHLNDRFRELLENIEKVWLGGFKGIFSQHARRPEILARFHQSFQSTLDKHLPSRQKAGRKGKTPRVTLDARILELFIGLGTESLENCDIDEPLTDLMYFVVDILQHHGERNAYDEIDFDSIAVEIQDALKSYHDAANADVAEVAHQHTILILDKALHAFPWESLPCMDGQAVSRLPSLGCLRDRIMEQQVRSKMDWPAGHLIDRDNGAYVLNPGSDLKSTQATFENDLENLGTWVGIVDRTPSENEMKDNLESKDLLLYFGHGSGDQYIRSKTIKRLQKCAVTVLMGCSSGALTEAGEFEPYGPPISYMLGGCPAVVATLWDVTDKDIDRFAKSTFEHWGLFESPLLDGGVKRKMKVAEQPSTDERKVSLVAAVAQGRKACNFRYLTAAAVCVYGVPVYFK